MMDSQATVPDVAHVVFEEMTAANAGGFGKGRGLICLFSPEHDS